MCFTPFHVYRLLAQARRPRVFGACPLALPPLQRRWLSALCLPPSPARATLPVGAPSGHHPPTCLLCHPPCCPKQFVNHLEIEVLPPVHPTEAERADWGLFAENVRRLMAARLGVLLVEQASREGPAAGCLGMHAMGAGWRGGLGCRAAAEPGLWDRWRPAAACAPQGIAEERQLWRMGVTVNLRGTRVVMPRQRKPKGE